MPYNKAQLGRDLKQRLDEGLAPKDIARWAFGMYNKTPGAEPEVDDVLLNLTAMEAGPEHELSQEALRALAFRLADDDSMPYDRPALGWDLRDRLNEGLTTDQIAKWAFTTFSGHQRKLGPGVRGLLLELSAMEEGPEFEMTREELHAMASRLVAEERWPSTMLTAKDIASKIREKLQGALSTKELADWAFQQFLLEDSADWYDPRDAEKVDEAIDSLMYSDEGPQMALDRQALEELIRMLES